MRGFNDGNLKRLGFGESSQSDLIRIQRLLRGLYPLALRHNQTTAKITR